MTRSIIHKNSLLWWPTEFELMKSQWNYIIKTSVVCGLLLFHANSQMSLCMIHNCWMWSNHWRAELLLRGTVRSWRNGLTGTLRFRIEKWKVLHIGFNNPVQVLGFNNPEQAESWLHGKWLCWKAHARWGGDPRQPAWLHQGQTVSDQSGGLLSQNHKMAWVGRDLKNHEASTPSATGMDTNLHHLIPDQAAQGSSSNFSAWTTWNLQPRKIHSYLKGATAYFSVML